MTETWRPRPRWMTVMLHAFLLSALVVDLWGTMFWARVGNAVGLSVAGVGAVVAVLLGTILLVDVRRQWLSRQRSDDGSHGRPGG